MTKKYTLVTISDHPLAHSGVGIQMKYIIEKLVSTGKFRVISIAAAIKHADYRPQKVSEWGDDVIIVPCDGYGNPDLLRKIMATENPDGLFIFTDPRFYDWLWNMEHEVRQQMPIIYNTIWDNYPAPKYNKSFYESCDFLGCINKVVYNIACELGFRDKAKYIPHGVPKEQFKILYDKTPEKLKLQFLGDEHKDSFLVFYNSRNAMRKRTGNVMMAFKEFRDGLPEAERDKAVMIMHTPPKDPEGQDLYVLVRDFGFGSSVRFSEAKLAPEVMAELYNASNVTISMSSEEGFGLSVLESLMCGTPVVCTKTGGMQDQIIDSETGDVFGFCVEPQARSLIGSQVTPYIWSDHFDPSVAAQKLRELYDSWKENKEEYKSKWAGEKARESMLRRFDLDTVKQTWHDEIVRTIDEFKARARVVDSFEI